MVIYIIAKPDVYWLIKRNKEWEKLEKLGHVAVFSYDYYDEHAEYNAKKSHYYGPWKAKKMEETEEIIRKADAVLVLNYSIDKYNRKEAITTKMFLELYEAHKNNKPIYCMNYFEESPFEAEAMAFNPITVNSIFEEIKYKL